MHQSHRSHKPFSLSSPADRQPSRPLALLQLGDLLFQRLDLRLLLARNTIEIRLHLLHLPLQLLDLIGFLRPNAQRTSGKSHCQRGIQFPRVTSLRSVTDRWREQRALPCILILYRVTLILYRVIFTASSVIYAAATLG